MSTTPALSTSTVVLDVSAAAVRVGDRFAIPSGEATLVLPPHSVQRKGSTYAVLAVEDHYGERDTVRWPARQTVTVTRTIETYEE